MDIRFSLLLILVILTPVQLSLAKSQKDKLYSYTLRGQLETLFHTLQDFNIKLQVSIFDFFNKFVINTDTPPNTIKNLHLYGSNQLSASDSEETTESEEFSITNHNQRNIEQAIINERFKNSNRDKKRQLQQEQPAAAQPSVPTVKKLECHYLSKKIKIKVEMYLHNGQPVLKNQFNYYKAVDHENTRIEHLETQACLCPADRFGQLCEYQNDILCKLIAPNQQEDMQNCKNESSFMYMSEYGGIAPCHKFSTSEPQKLNIQVRCQNQFTDKEMYMKSMVHGYEYYEILWEYYYAKDGEEKVYSHGEQTEYKFEYFFDDFEHNFVSSNEKRFFVQMSFIDWNRLGFYGAVKLNMTDEPSLEQLQGMENIQVEIDLGAFQNYSQQGRYYSQMDVMVQDIYKNTLGEDVYIKAKSVIEQPYLIVYDDINFNEFLEQNSLKKHKYLALIAGVALVCLFIALAMWCNRRCKLRRLIKKRQKSYAEFKDEQER